MIKARPLSDQEVSLLQSHLTTPWSRALFVLGHYTGFRISELLSLKSEALRGALEVTVSTRNMKGRGRSRTVPLHPVAKEALAHYLTSHISLRAFPHHRTSFNRHLKEACEKAGIDPNRVSSHSMRKTFATRIYAKSNNDIFKTKDALGHVSINNTVAYLELNRKEIDDLILSA